MALTPREIREALEEADTDVCPCAKRLAKLVRELRTKEFVALVEEALMWVAHGPYRADVGNKLLERFEKEYGLVPRKEIKW